jgi:hypothetical protein
VEFEVNSNAVKFAIVPAGPHPWAGNLIVAMFGDDGALTGAPESRVGRKLIRVDPADWSVHPTKTVPLQRPIDLVFDSRDSAAYVLDFGEFEITEQKGVSARAGSGCLWKLTPDFMDA